MERIFKVTDSLRNGHNVSATGIRIEGDVVRLVHGTKTAAVFYRPVSVIDTETQESKNDGSKK